MMPSFRISIPLSLCFLFCLVYPSAASGKLPTGLADGAGVWMNIWNYPDGQSVERYCQELHNHGIHNCFVQTSRSNTDAIAHPTELSLLLDACHRHGIKVIAWSFTELSNPVADAQRLLTAARFKTASGESLDGIASDMESNLSPATVTALGQTLRDALGASYPLAAIVYSPLNRAVAAANVPWKVLPKYFDIIAPMTYWSGKTHKFDPYAYTASTIKQIRQLVGRSDIEIHPIGDGIRATTDEFRLFMQACRDNEAASASLYPNQKLTAAQLNCLTEYGTYFPPDSHFRLAAYRQLRNSGVLPEPPQGDPARYISRGCFYQLVLAQTRTQSQLSQEETYRYLADHGIAVSIADGIARNDFLNSPISSAEALSLIASLVESKRPPTSPAHTPRRKGPWLIQPAKAAEYSPPAGGIAARISPTQISPSQVAPAKGSQRPLDYLDAAQLILQSRAGLR